MQESRLFKIVYHLLEKGQTTAPELAEKFEARKHEKSMETVKNKEKPKEKESILVDLGKKKEEIAKNSAKKDVEKATKVKGGEVL